MLNYQTSVNKIFIFVIIEIKTKIMKQFYANLLKLSNKEFGEKNNKRRKSYFNKQDKL